MSSPLLPSALDTRTQAFPVLSVSQIDRIRACSRSRQVAAGDILFEPGDENVPFLRTPVRRNGDRAAGSRGRTPDCQTLAGPVHPANDHDLRTPLSAARPLNRPRPIP